MTSDSEKALQADHVERNNTKSAGKGAKVKRHCAKWWWIYLLLLVVIVLVITLPIVYVAFPKQSQDAVNDSYNEVTDFQFLNPTENSVELTQRVILHSPSKFTPTLDPFTATTYLVTNGTFASEPLLSVDLPKVHALHPTSNTNVINQTVTLLNLDQVNDFTTQVMTQENVTTALTGKTKLHLGKLPTTTVNYNSSSTYKGLNGLKGFNVTNVKIDLTNTLLIAPNMNGTAYIPNPSVLTIELGNVSLALSTKSGAVGHVEINNMIIRPGDNNLPLTGILNQTLVLNDLDNGFVNLTIVGTSAVRNGQHLTYYEKALASNVLHLTLNVAQVLKDSIGG